MDEEVIKVMKKVLHYDEKPELEKAMLDYEWHFDEKIIIPITGGGPTAEELRKCIKENRKYKPKPYKKGCIY